MDFATAVLCELLYYFVFFILCCFMTYDAHTIYPCAAQTWSILT